MIDDEICSLYENSIYSIHIAINEFIINCCFLPYKAIFFQGFYSKWVDESS